MSAILTWFGIFALIFAQFLFAATDTTWGELVSDLLLLIVGAAIWSERARFTQRDDEREHDAVMGVEFKAADSFKRGDMVFIDSKGYATNQAGEGRTAIGQVLGTVSKDGMVEVDLSPTQLVRVSPGTTEFAVPDERVKADLEAMERGELIAFEAMGCDCPACESIRNQSSDDESMAKRLGWGK